MTRNFFIAAIASVFVVCFPNAVFADSAAEIDEKSKAALASLVASSEGARAIVDEAVAYYSSAAASYGSQAGIQKFGYVLFLMNEGALKYLDNSGGCPDGC